jgi:hypothetical protein
MIFKFTQPDYILGMILGLVFGTALSVITFLVVHKPRECPVHIELRGSVVDCQAETFQDVIEGKVPCLS